MKIVKITIALYGMLYNIEAANVYCGRWNEIDGGKDQWKERCGKCPVVTTYNYSGSSKSSKYYCSGECEYKQINYNNAYCGHGVAYFEIKEDQDNNGPTVCKVTFSDSNLPLLSSKDNMWNNYGCNNDKGQSMRICHATEGTKIKLYDNESHNDNDSNTNLEIRVKIDLRGRCANVRTFDDPKDTDDLDFTRTKKWWTNGKLNNRVSSFKVTL